LRQSRARQPFSFFNTQGEKRNVNPSSNRRQSSQCETLNRSNQRSRPQNRRRELYSLPEIARLIARAVRLEEANARFA
jgi:hypothetical protein